jgi:hypothetical protein
MLILMNAFTIMKGIVLRRRSCLLSCESYKFLGVKTLRFIAETYGLNKKYSVGDIVVWGII